MKKILSAALSMIIAMQSMALVHATEPTLIYKQYTTDDGSYTALVSNGSPTGSSALETEVVSGKTYLKIPATIASENVRTYTAAMYSGRIPAANKKQIEVTFKKEAGIVSGVRFYTNTFATSGVPRCYYQLSFGTDKAWSLFKMENSTQTMIEESSVTAELNEGEYNLCVIYDEENITWRIVNTDGDVMAGANSISEDWNNATASEPFSEQENSFALIAANGNSDDYAWYTNLNVYSTDGTNLPSAPGTGGGTGGGTPVPSEWIYTFTDNFTDTTYVKDTLAEEIGPWKTNGVRGELTALTTELQVVDKQYGGVNKTALCVPSTALFNKPHQFTAAELDENIPSGGKMEFKFSFKKDGEMVDGIRFMIHNNGSNFYEFLFNRNGNTSPAWALNKVVEGVRTQLAGGDAGLIPSGTDYNVKLVYDYADYCGNISWDVTRCDGGSVTFTGHTGSAEDITPFKHLGTTKMAMISGGQNAKYSYFTDISIRTTETHEEPAFNPDDPAIVAAYVVRHNQLIAPYNTAVSQNDTAAMKEFLTGTARLSMGRMEHVNVPAIAEMDDTALTAFANRLITYGDTITFTDISDIDDFQKRLESEIAIGNLCGMDNIEVMGVSIDDITQYVDINLSTNSYLSMKETIIGRLLNNTFLSANDFKSKFNEAVIMENYQYTINGNYLLGIIEEYSSEIGYNSAHYDTLDKSALAEMLISQTTKAAVTTVAALRDKIDTFTVASSVVTPSPSPAPSPAPSVPQGPTQVVGGGVSSGSGGGGSGGGGNGYGIIRDIPKQTEAPKENITQPIVDKTVIFADVPTDYWAYEAIRFMNARKAVTGYGDGSFNPEGQVTRAEFLTMLLGIYGIEKPESYPDGIGFDDVKEGDWYYDVVMTAASIGILGGDGVSAYPNAKITRQEMAVLICRILEYLKIEINTNSELTRFIDDGEIDVWAFLSVKKLQAAGIANGSDGYYMPKASAKRAEAAQMLFKAVNVDLKQAEENNESAIEEEVANEA